jgi:hypothetical protein
MFRDESYAKRTSCLSYGIIETGTLQGNDQSNVKPYSTATARILLA